MAGTEDVMEATRRLEDALERIAFLASRRRPAEGPALPAQPQPEPPAEMAARLDELITDLRSTLSSNSPKPE